MSDYRQHIRENLKLALDTLRTHKFRSFLTILGVLIGTMTVIGVASIFKGLDQQIVDMASDFGTRTLFIYKFEPGIKFRLSREERMRKPLTFEDAQAIREQCPAVESVSAELFRWGPSPMIKYKGQELLDGNFSGPTPEQFQNVNANLRDGRFFGPIDNLHRRNVAVIGADVVERFFTNEDPIGKTILVDGHSFEIIGTIEKRKAFLGDNGNDRVVWIPYFTFRKIYPDSKENFITALAYPGKLNQAIDEVTGVLRRQRKVKPSEPDSFGIATAESLISQFRDIMGTVVLVTVVVSSIGLLVGGIGVMNIMLVSVTERTREIGVRKAIGARRSDITWQFLLEAMTLTGLGGILGVLLGIALSFSIRTLLPQLPSTVPLWSVVAGFVVAVSIGLFFGIWPALKASRLDPIVALRHE
ncbi:MAG TPA: ABC transporter permease [Terriglobia bacterium]|nr:ABC transporter permease [Terriglobia bacterium]